MKKHIIDNILKASKIFFERELLPATSGNLSGRLDKENIIITASGVHKGFLKEKDFVTFNLITEKHKPLTKKPSAETFIHKVIYEVFGDANYVFHTHSLYGTLLSKTKKRGFFLKDYELLKAFPKITTHESSVFVPVFENNQDIKALSLSIKEYLEKNKKSTYGFLLYSHGLYSWGKDFIDAFSRIEAFEFMLKCEFFSDKNIDLSSSHFNCCEDLD